MERLGVIGKPSDWLIASQVDKGFVEKTLQIELVDIPIEEVTSLGRVDGGKEGADRIYERLKENKGLKDFAAVKTPETYLWDVRATNAGDGWQLEPVPKAAKKAFKALGLTPPDKIS